MAQKIDFNGGAWGYAYYDDGLLRTQTDAKGQVVSFEYDNLGRETSRTYSQGATALGAVTTEYSNGGRGENIARVLDTTQLQSVEVLLGYDNFFRLASVETRKGGTSMGRVDYTYTPSDRVATRTEVQGGTPVETVSYAYYADGSLKNIAALEGTYTFNYLLTGQIVSIAMPEGVSRNFAYDLQGRLTQIKNMHSVSVISQYDYEWDKNHLNNTFTKKGQIAGMTETLAEGAFASKYYYDALYQLAGADYPDYPVSWSVDGKFDNRRHTWTYDAIGNRKQQDITSRVELSLVERLQYVYNANSAGVADKGQELLTINDVTSGTAVLKKTFTYDGAGNTMGESEGAATTSYTWLPDNKLKQIILNGNPVEQNIYDYSGNRVARIEADGVERTYLYGQGGEAFRTKKGMETTRYIDGSGIDDVLAARINNANNVYYFADHLGSVRQIINGMGAVQNRYEYGAWGERALKSETVFNPWGYTGREFAETGKYYFRWRYQFPEVGRFGSVDPMEALISRIVSRYVYVDNQPTLFFDPEGLLTWKEGNCPPNHLTSGSLYNLG